MQKAERKRQVPMLQSQTEKKLNPLTNEELNHLLDFVGYGSPKAPVWFLGMEEGGGGEDNIRRRLAFRTVEDLAEAHEKASAEKHHRALEAIQPTWRGMCDIMLGLEGKEVSRENRRSYQAKWLGRYNGSTLLVELMPILKPRIDQWGYEQLIPQFASAIEYYDKVLERRTKYLRQLLRENSPQVVICYGKAFWKCYQRLFPGMKFNFTDKFILSMTDHPLVMLTNHFTSPTMNKRFCDIVSVIKARRVRITFPA